MTRLWNRPLGRPARRNASAMRSPTSSVCAACFRMMALPASSAGHDGVDRGEIGIVPRRDHHHDADRLARDIAAEARLLRRVIRLERLLGERHHGADALLDAALLAAIADRPAHLPGELHGDVVVHREQRIEKGEHVARALGDRNGPPFGQRGAGRRQRSLDLGVARDRPLGIDRAVDGRDDLHCFRHVPRMHLNIARNRASAPNP